VAIARSFNYRQSVLSILSFLSFLHSEDMRAFVSALVLVGAALAQAFEKRRNVVPSTCDPNVVQTM
jgi:hypothetical protein